MDFDYKLILWCVYAGILIAAVYICYQKTVIGRLVSTLLEKGCDSPETAMTLAELGLEKHLRIRTALKPRSTLSRLVLPISESIDGASPAKNTFDFSTTRFYLPVEKREKAKHYNRESSSLFTLLIAVIGGLILVVLGHLLIPYLSSLFTEILS